jgi:uncharacterized protein (TIGR02996 family)
MSDADGLFRAIIDQPEDDVPRLVYADWLDEHGEPDRAAFIRAQCELARLPLEDERASELTARSLRLLTRHVRAWQGDNARHSRFHRGLVEELYWCDPCSLVEHIEELFANHPIRDVELCGQPDKGWGRPLANRPELARIETLRLTHSRSGWLQFDDVLALLRSPHLGRVTTLDLSGGDGGHRYGHRRFNEIIRTRRGQLLPALRNLRRLSLNGLRLTDESVQALIESPLAQTLTHLDLSDNDESAHDAGITIAGLRALVGSPLWARLEELNLGQLYLRDPEASEVVVSALPGSRIRRLGLGAFLYHEHRGGGHLIRALNRASSWGEVRELNLSWNALEAAEVRRLARCPALGQVARLDFGGMGIDDAGIAALAASPFLRGLRHLRVEDQADRITGAAVEALAASKHLTGLVTLQTDCRGIDNDAIAAFARSTNAANLRVWVLPTSVADDGLRAIANSPNCRSLTMLLFGYLGGSTNDRVTEAGAQALVESANLPHLAVFDRHPYTITPGALRILNESERIACPKANGLNTLDLFEFVGPNRFFGWSKDAFA